MPTFVIIIPTIFLGIWLLLCIATIISPRYVWKITQSWKATKEPPRAYFIFSRIMAVVFLLVAATLFFPGFFH